MNVSNLILKHLWTIGREREREGDCCLRSHEMMCLKTLGRKRRKVR